MSGARTVVLLATDAFRDGLRNRAGLFALVFALLIGLFADRCTSFDGGSVLLNGRSFDLREGARLMGPMIFGVCTLMLVLVAGFLACDALSRPLSQGVTMLWLSRPVGRGAYAMARLAGSLGLALIAGVCVLGIVAALLHFRLGLSPGPALAGVAVFVVEAWVVSALAMALALFVPRVVALAVVVLTMQTVVFANVLHTVATTDGGILLGIHRFGPPLGTALLCALSPWFGDGASPAELWNAGLRLLLWGAASSALVVLSFRRMDLPS